MEGYYGFNAGKTFLTFGPHDKVKGKNLNPDRMMYNFETRDVKGEFERIKGFGAKVVAEPYKMGEEADGWIATFADPDGNYFQLMTPWEGYRKPEKHASARNERWRAIPDETGHYWEEAISLT